MDLNFDAIFYYVSDLDRAVVFYQDLMGFKFVSRDVVARFDVGGVLFEVVPTQDVSRLSGRGNARLCLRVDDIHVAVAELRRRGILVGDEERKDNGFLAELHDPDNNEICLWQYA
jgi:catechol 2,3-dioxygenase-like lactoylglutathione lyase family enzyme